MSSLFEKVYKLPDFHSKLPDLFAYLVSRQPTKNPEYNWLQQFIDIRNTIEHGGLDVSEDMLEFNFPLDKQKAEFVRKISNYAAEVRLFVGESVKNFVNSAMKQTAV